MIKLHNYFNNVLSRQIKYTAYSGWISSGLVFWTIDKVAIVDSSGKTLSVCRKGLILDSGQSVYLPLYPGECNIPLDTENSSSLSILIERMATDEQQQGGIGPFTKEQNYESKDSGYSVEIVPTDRIVQKKGLGPYTKEQNLHIAESGTTAFGDAEKRRNNIANPWTVLDISNDGDSNSLENSESESGRGFSGGANNLIYRASPTAERVAESTIAAVVTTEFLPEIKEPVLRLNKKETGRSLKLHEITEPILNPRATRQNVRNEAVAQQDEIQETSSTSTRAFTVQFLPERLASILAQAERYARQTLLPLISQYTPSFVTGMRHDEPKYFPLLGDLSRQKSATEVDKTTDRPRNDHITRANIGQRDSSVRPEEASTSSAQTENGENEYTVSRAEVPPVIVEAVYPEKIANFTGLEARTMTAETRREDSGWRPIGEPATFSKDVSPRRDLNVSRSLDWSVGYNRDWSSSRTANSEVKTDDDWVPITVKSDAVQTTTQSATSKEELTMISPVKETDDNKNSKKSEDRVFDKEEATSTSTYERKYIPLFPLEETTGNSTSSTDSQISESTTISSHIQKIPRVKEASVKSARTMMVPYVYERKNDPRTRYIPLIPEEDMGKPYSLMERHR